MPQKYSKYERLKALQEEVLQCIRPIMAKANRAKDSILAWRLEGWFCAVDGLRKGIWMMREVFVEIIAKKKGCMLCDLAIAVLEEVAPEFAAGALRWDVVDVGAREGLERLDQLTRIAGRRPAVPSIVINQGIAFDHIPDYDRLHDAVARALAGTDTPGT